MNGTSNMYAPTPSHRLIQGDLLIGIRQYKNSVICKEFWLKCEEGSRKDSEGV